MQTKKRKHRILFEKFERNILGVVSTVYVLHIGKTGCKRLTIKKRKIRQYIVKKLGILQFLEKHRVFSKRLPRHKDTIRAILEHMNTNTKYTYCLNQDNLIFAETRTKEENVLLKDWLSKHVILCDDNVCASGEMVVYRNHLIFDNSSGTYAPTAENLESIKESLSFLPVKVITRDSTEHEKYFGKYDYKQK